MNTEQNYKDYLSARYRIKDEAMLERVITDMKRVLHNEKVNKLGLTVQFPVMEKVSQIVSELLQEQGYIVHEEFNYVYNMLIVRKP